MPSIHEMGPVTFVWETDEETFDKYAVEYNSCKNALRRFETRGQEYEPAAMEIKDKMYRIGNMYSGDEPFIQEGTSYLAKGMIGEMSLYRRRELWIQVPLALNPPEESPEDLV